VFVLPEVFDNGENTFADTSEKASYFPVFIYSLLHYAPTLLSVYARREKTFIYA